MALAHFAFVVSAGLFSSTKPTDHGDISITVTIDLPAIFVASFLWWKSFANTEVPFFRDGELFHRRTPYVNKPWILCL